MKALTLKEYQVFEYGEVAEPEVGDDEVLVGVKACGICGSDIHGMDGSSGRRIPPVIMGHEASGEIVKVGSGVEGWAIGERVGFDSMIYCGDCDSCDAGETNLCEERRVIGVSCEEYRRNGAFAEYVVIPQHVLVRLPEGLSYEEAAFGEPVAVALHAVGRVGEMGEETSAVVVGAGLIGLLVVQALRVAGCGRVLAVDLDEGRLELAKRFGAEAGINSGDLRILEKVREWAGGDGADVAMEVVGITPTIQLAAKSLRKGGTLGCVGNIAATVEFPLQEVVTRELSAVGSCASAGEYGRALELLAAGEIEVKPLISGVADLSEGGDWFGRLYEGTEGLMKILLRP
ncbi:MAG: galactitol-1-phosphate 5-dehydrogenase [Verrucomicrobiota bacterium]